MREAENYASVEKRIRKIRIYASFGSLCCLALIMAVIHQVRNGSPPSQQQARLGSMVARARPSTPCIKRICLSIRDVLLLVKRDVSVLVFSNVHLNRRCLNMIWLIMILFCRR